MFFLGSDRNVSFSGMAKKLSCEPLLWCHLAFLLGTVLAVLYQRGFGTHASAVAITAAVAFPLGKGRQTTAIDN